MILVNLTPHPLTLHGSAGVMVLPPDPRGPARRSAPRSSAAGSMSVLGLGSIAVLDAAPYGAVTGLPDPVGGVAYIVSSIVADGCRDRRDVYSPGTGPGQGAVRNEAGHVVGVTALVCAWGGR